MRWACKPGFDHDALVSCEDKQTDEFLAFFRLGDREMRWPFGGLHQGSEDVRICLDHIGTERFQSK